VKRAERTEEEGEKEEDEDITSRTTRPLAGRHFSCSTPPPIERERERERERENSRSLKHIAKVILLTFGLVEASLPLACLIRANGRGWSSTRQ